MADNFLTRLLRFAAYPLAQKKAIVVDVLEKTFNPVHKSSVVSKPPASAASKPPASVVNKLIASVANKTSSAIKNNVSRAAGLSLINENVLVSIIIPCFNEERFVALALDSIISQSYRKWEAIVINDCSTDRTVEIVEGYKKRDSRIRLLHHAKNSGLSASRNTGVKAANGEVIVFLDGDDTLLEGSLLSRLKVLQNTPHATGSYCTYQVTDEDGSAILLGPQKPRTEIITALAIGADCPFPVHCPLVLKEAFDHFGLFREDMRDGAEDWELWQRMLQGGAVFVPSGEISVTYRQRRKSMVHVDPSGHYWAFKPIVERAYAGGYEKAAPCFSKGIHSVFNDRKLFGRSIRSIVLTVYAGKIDSAKKILDTLDSTLFPLIPPEEFVQLFSVPIARMECIGTKDVENNKERNAERLHELFNLLDAKLGAHQWVLDIAREKILGVPMPQRLGKKPLWMYSANELSENYKVPAAKTVTTATTQGGGKAPSVNTLPKAEKPGRAPAYKFDMVDFDIVDFDMAPHVQRMLEFKDKYKGKRCFLVGNGPSLNQMDLGLLKDEYTFGVNGIFYKHDDTGFKPTFYIVEDNHVMADNRDRINAIDYSVKFFPHRYNWYIKPGKDVIFFKLGLGFYRETSPHYCKPRFSKNCEEAIYAGQTVTFVSLQLAFYMGFTEVYLIGMDFSYIVPASSDVQGVNILSNEDDPNHFHPDYFGKGKKWHDPKLDNCILTYQYAKKIYEEDNRRIYNASIGGKLDVFDRVDYLTLFKSDK